MARNNYTPLASGLKELGNSDGMKRETLAVARTIATKANQRGKSRYEAKGQTVHLGWKNEPRAGAAVSEKEEGRDWRDSRDRVLLRVTASMAIRGRR